MLKFTSRGGGLLSLNGNGFSEVAYNVTNYFLKFTSLVCYFAVYFVGFIKSWQPADTPLFSMDSEIDLSTSSCFFGIGTKVEVLAEQLNSKSVNIDHDPIQFTYRCAADGHFLHVDPK